MNGDLSTTSTAPLGYSNTTVSRPGRDASVQEVSRENTGGEDRAAAVYRLQPGVEHEFRKWRCTRCPWRTDADLTAFSEQDMDMLRRADGGPGAEAPLDAPVVGCHLDQPDTAHAFRWCAGWLATVGEYHLAIRLAIAFEALPGDAVTPRANWPRLYASLEALLAGRAGHLRQDASVCR
ncbi:DUF6283 family protein [Streptomyces sp. CC219B]|uniref:DUF6283 family protein n=1 Tax=Streptomyces sp. CC219B TaxID=3044574 RepID=UPI0024A95D88|nr:DUF6283 family protein [Streptomyces sp. CC219B]